MKNSDGKSEDLLRQKTEELAIANKELAFQNKEKEKRANELTIANKELNIQIYERKLAEVALRNSHEELHRLLNSMAEGAYGIDNTGNCTFINKSFLQVLGYQNDDELLGKKIHELIHHSYYDGSPYPSSECKAKNIYQPINSSDEVFWRKDDVAIPVEYWAYPIEKDGVVIGSVVTFNDITERKKAENLLKESEQKSMSIMENSADAIFITNQQGKYVYTNKAVSDMLGYTSEEMKSKTIADISPPNKIEEYFKFFEQILNEGKSFTEIELLKKDGNYISTDLNTVLLPDGTIYGSCRDITERKKAESELIKAKEKAEESDRLKSAFLTNMSHEIRTPMNGILGFAQLLREPDLTDENKQKFLAIIEKSSARMLNIISAIVSISKIESEQMEISISETNVNEQINFVYNFFKPVVEENGMQLIVKNALPLIEAIIKSDSEKIYSILTNLVGNATKFTHSGSIEFGYEKKDKYLEFFVKDTGDGIADESKEIIFERFRHENESMTRNYEGAGLGLSISKAYVEMLGGKIWVESELGKGSTFYFTIPYNAYSC